jgi:alpha-N-arabinofuranosidase
VEYCNHDGPSTLADERRANGSVAPFGVRYWGVGNESWGCGGRMTAHRYADEFARYAIYLFPFGGKAPCRIACGPSGDSPEWTRRFFEALSGQRDGAPSRLNLLDAFAAHYYCGTAGTAMDYTVDQWYELLAKALRVEPLIVRHRAIMDGFDPERRIGLILDEWGTWHPVIPGTPPRFLRQQNTIRDGLVAALTLDVLNRHADKVVMANIAQMVNVLQAMCLTDGPRMFVTPTYHVYDMYAPHQDATSVATRVEAEPIPFATDRSQGNVAGVAGSASVRGDRLTLSLVNAHVSEGVAARIVLRPLAARSPESVRVLAADDIHAHNDFGSSDRVRPHEGVATGNAVELPPASVAVLAYPVS